MEHVWGRGEVYTGFWWEDLGERGHLEDPNGRIILRCIFRMWDGGMDWTDMAQDLDRWHTLMRK
jgi:hypothetical protein